MNTLFAQVKNFVSDEEGAAAVEYGLLAALIAIVIIASVTSLGKTVCQTFSTLATKLGGSSATCPA